MTIVHRRESSRPIGASREAFIELCVEAEVEQRALDGGDASLKFASTGNRIVSGDVRDSKRTHQVKRPWGQRDPVGYVDGSNRYSFVSDNVIGGTDPSGLQMYSPLQAYAPLAAGSGADNGYGSNDYFDAIERIKADPCLSPEMKLAKIRTLQAARDAMWQQMGGLATGPGGQANGSEQAALVQAFGNALASGSFDWSSWGGGGGGGGGFDPFGNGFLDLIGKIWNLPNTLIGLGLGGAELLIGNIKHLFGGPSTYFTFGNNAVQFWGSPLMPWGDLTIGNTIHYNPEFKDPEHETQHTYQGQLVGPLYLPLNAIGGVAAWIGSGAWHGPQNFMETGPQQTPPVPFPGWSPK